MLWLVVLWIITAINPLYPRDWLLENLLVFIYGALLVITYRWFKFSNLCYGLFTLFLSLHLLGAHYTYAETPFGLLIAYLIRELLMRKSGVNVAWSYFITINCIMAFSAVYEVLEGITAMVVSPELGSA